MADREEVEAVARAMLNTPKPAKEGTWQRFTRYADAAIAALDASRSDTGGERSAPPAEEAIDHMEAVLNDALCDCFIPTLEGAGQHSPGCMAVKVETRTLARTVLSSPEHEAALAELWGERDRWIRLFNRLEAAVSRHIGAKGTSLYFSDDVDDALCAAHGQVLKAASSPAPDTEGSSGGS